MQLVICDACRSTKDLKKSHGVDLCQGCRDNMKANGIVSLFETWYVNSAKGLLGNLEALPNWPKAGE